MPLPDAQRRALLEAMYQHAIALEAEKAATKRILDEQLDAVGKIAGLSRREVKDWVRSEIYPDYYRRRRVEDRGHL